MTTFPYQCVLDVSVLAKYVIAEPETPVVEQLSDKALADGQGRLCISELTRIELGNVLWKKARAGALSLQDAREAITSILQLHLPDLSHRPFAVRAVEIATTYGISAYAASDIALAEQLQLPLITADARLVNALTGKPVSDKPVDIRVITPRISAWCPGRELNSHGISTGGF